MKKLVLLVCLAFCASSFAQSTASVAQTADEKKMIFQIQPVTDSSAQDQSYNEGAEVDLSVWNHQKDKKKDKSLNWTVAEIKKANGLTSDTILAGQILKIPSASQIQQANAATTPRTQAPCCRLYLRDIRDYAVPHPELRAFRQQYIFLQH